MAPALLVPLLMRAAQSWTVAGLLLSDSRFPPAPPPPPPPGGQNARPLVGVRARPWPPAPVTDQPGPCATLEGSCSGPPAYRLAGPAAGDPPPPPCRPMGARPHLKVQVTGEAATEARRAGPGPKCAAQDAGKRALAGERGNGRPGESPHSFGMNGFFSGLSLDRRSRRGGPPAPGAAEASRGRGARAACCAPARVALAGRGPDWRALAASAGPEGGGAAGVRAREAGPPRGPAMPRRPLAREVTPLKYPRGVGLTIFLHFCASFLWRPRRPPGLPPA